jgi:predicted nucleic acid-binding protein
MRWYFLDSWYFIARFNRFDADHHAAMRLSRTIGARSQMTHDGVLTEVLAYFSGFGSQMRANAAKNVRDALEDFLVVPVDRSLFVRALALYERRPNKEYSLTDCVSMIVMRDRGIEHVLTNDRHFQQEGFFLVNE